VSPSVALPLELPGPYVMRKVTLMAAGKSAAAPGQRLRKEVIDRLCSTLDKLMVHACQHILSEAIDCAKPVPALGLFRSNARHGSSYDLKFDR